MLLLISLLFLVVCYMYVCMHLRLTCSSKLIHNIDHRGFVSVTSLAGEDMMLMPPSFSPDPSSSAKHILLLRRRTFPVFPVAPASSVDFSVTATPRDDRGGVLRTEVGRVLLEQHDMSDMLQNPMISIEH